MSTLRKPRPITVEEYLEGEKRGDVKHEFIGGDLHAMVGASRAHNLIAQNFAAALRQHLRGTACQAFIADVKLRIGNDFYYPDVLVACDGPDADPYFTTQPLVAVEVMSPTSATRDLHDKRIAYQGAATLREYVLVEQDRREVRVYRRVDAGWDVATFAGTDPIELASVEFRLSMDELYRDVLR